MASDPARRLDVPGCYEIYGSEAWVPRNSSA